MCYLCKIFMNIQFQNKTFIWVGEEGVNSWAVSLSVVLPLSLGGFIHKLEIIIILLRVVIKMPYKIFSRSHLSSFWFCPLVDLPALPKSGHSEFVQPMLSPMPLMKMLTKKKRDSCRRCWTQQQHPHWTWIVFQLAMNGLTHMLHLRLKI